MCECGYSDIVASSTDMNDLYQFRTDNCGIDVDGCQVNYVIVSNATLSAVVVVRERCEWLWEEGSGKENSL